MSFIPAIYGIVNTTNSSTATLTANSSFTGTSSNVLNYASVTVNVSADQPSATGGVQLQFSSDGTNWDNVQYSTFIPAASCRHCIFCTVYICRSCTVLPRRLCQRYNQPRKFSSANGSKRTGQQHAGPKHVYVR